MRLNFREKEIIVKALAPKMNFIGGPAVDPTERNLYLRMVKYVQNEYKKREKVRCRSQKYSTE